jgi:hypothetical protein
MRFVFEIFGVFAIAIAAIIPITAAIVTAAAVIAAFGLYVVDEEAEVW